MHVPRVTRYTFLTTLFLIVTATAGVFIASHVFADIPYQEAHPFIITPNNHSFALIAGETATTSFVVGALGYTSQYSLDTYPSCLTYDDTNGNCIEYAADSLLCDYISLTDLDGEDEYKSLNDETDPTDAWMLTLSAPCIEGACPEGHNDDYKPPLPRALVGTELSCDIRVGGRPVFVKAGIFDTFVHRFSDAVTAFAASSPYYVLHVTATITEASSTPACTEHCYSNVLFLPGAEASRLYRPDFSGGTDQLWLPTTTFSDDVNELALDADGKSYKKDIYTKPGDVLDEALGISKIYHSFIGTMDQLKEDGTIADWEAIPYDWRLSLDDILNNGNASRFADGRISYIDGEEGATSTPYIEQELKRLAATSKSGKVTIVAHSMGGLVTKALMQQLGDDASQYVDRIILVASPQVGTPQAIAGLLHGYDQSIPGVVPFIVTDRAMRELGNHAPAAYHLLPSAGYFHYVDDPVVEFDADELPDTVARYGATIHSQERLRTFLTDTHLRPNPDDANTDMPTSLVPALLSQAEAAHAELDTWTPPEGVELVQIAGWGIPKTVKTVKYGQAFTLPCIGLNCPPEEERLTFDPVFTTDGDGTVVVPSALWTSTTTGAKNYWVDIAKYNSLSGRIMGTHFLGVSHGDILEIPELLTHIRGIITESSGVLPQYISTEAPISEEKRLRFELHSPLTLDLYDSEGRHTGISTTTGMIEEQIPGTYYQQFGDVKYLFADASASYHLVLDGYASGTFTLHIEELTGDDLVASTTFKNIPTATTTEVKMDIATGGITELSNLRIDRDGDGSVDFALAPKLGGVVMPDLTPPEAVISVDLVTKDLKIEGVDTSSTTITKANNSYTITDSAGNTTKLFFQKTYTGKMLSFAKLTGVQYNNASATPVATSSLLYLWNPLVNPPVLLSQTVAVNDQFIIEAVYDKKTNKTTVFVKKKGMTVQKQTFNGLKVIPLSTNKGVVGYQL